MIGSLEAVILINKHIGFQCFFKVVNLPLKPVIKGGDRRTISRNSKLVLDASYSVDPNKDSVNRKKDLRYIWSCNNRKLRQRCFKVELSGKVLFYHFMRAKSVIHYFLSFTLFFTLLDDMLDS